MVAPVFLEYDAECTIRTNGLHWEGFPRLAWEAPSTTGYTVLLVYKVAEFERLGVPRCRVTVTVPLHPVHPEWFNLSLVYWGFHGHESVESATLRVLTDFCDHTHSGSRLTIWAVSGSEPARPSVAGPCGPPSGAAFPSGATGRHEDADSLPQHLVHISGAALHHRDSDQLAVGDCSADLAQPFSSLPAAEFHTLPGSAGERLASYQEVPAGAGAR
jgi:hypothetical protein